MAENKRFFDVWLVQSNTVYKEVPYHVVADWVQQVRVSADDMIKPAGSSNWFRLGTLPMFQPYIPQASDEPENPAQALEPIELDFNWKRRPEDEDDDVDMIPLIDISLVLLIFFMMTTSVVSLSRVPVPAMQHATKIEKDQAVLRIDVEIGASGSVTYGVAKGIKSPEAGNGNLTDEVDFVNRLDAFLSNEYTYPPKVRIAADQNLSFEVVEKVMQVLDRRRQLGQIAEYTIEVKERVGP